MKNTLFLMFVSMAFLAYILYKYAKSLPKRYEVQKNMVYIFVGFLAFFSFFAFRLVFH